MMTICALVFGAVTSFAVGFQIALACGAPWGEWANGGRWRGTLPTAMRIVSVAQAALLSILIAVVWSHAGLLQWAAPSWAIWVVVGITALSSVMNLATPSVKERRLWAPIVIVACLSAASVGFLV